MTGREIALYAAQTADEKKATDIILYDVRGVTDVTDFFVIMTAHSKAQVRAIIETINRELKQCGVRKIGREGTASGQWVLLDYSDCVIHVFTPELREYYALESLWGDAPQIRWNAEPTVKLKKLVPAVAGADAEDDEIDE